MSLQSDIANLLHHLHNRKKIWDACKKILEQLRVGSGFIQDNLDADRPPALDGSDNYVLGWSIKSQWYFKNSDGITSLWICVDPIAGQWYLIVGPGQ
jgi:hypothetical protein